MSRKLLDVENVPQGSGLTVAYCSNPACGPHLIILDDDGKPMAQVAIPHDRVLGFIDALRDIVYDKVANSDDPKSIQ